MGNSASGRSSLSSCEKKVFKSNNCVVDRTRALTVDPRSPSEGIVRTPIQLDRRENGWATEESKTIPQEKLQNYVVSPKLENVGDVCVIELNNFETLDGFLTEDDSVHQPDLMEEGISALSDTNLTNRTKRKESFLTANSLPRMRLSWMERFGHSRRKSARDSPSLLVRMRHKHNLDKRRTEQFHQHGGDGLPHDTEREQQQQQEHEEPHQLSTEKSRAEEPVIS